MENQDDALRGFSKVDSDALKKDGTRLSETKIGFGNHGTYHYPLIEVPPHELFFSFEFGIPWILRKMFAFFFCFIGNFPLGTNFLEG